MKRRPFPALNMIGVPRRIGLLLVALWSAIIPAFAQGVIDIKTPIFISHFSEQYKEPLYVTYTLYRGGGTCDRSLHELWE
jgi:hypothetical protein